MLTRQAVILVGGKGTRLGSLAKDTPKPLMPLDDTTVFLDDVLFDIARHGFNDIILASGHLAEQVHARYHDRTVRDAHIRVVIEPQPAGTAGALKTIGALLQPTFLLANGDTSFDINLRRLDMLLAKEDEAIGVIALRRVPDAGRYGSVSLDNEYVRAFHEKCAESSGVEGLINGGTGLFRREIVGLIDRVPCSIESDIYPVLVARSQLLGREFSGYFLDIGLPETLAQARADMKFRHRRPALFLDRDGVINRDTGYTWQVHDLVFIAGAVDTIRTANDMGLMVIVVTNQAGVARGLYSETDVDCFHSAMSEALAIEGAHIDAFYTCPYHPDAAVDAFKHPDHPDRKPNPGMILRALREWPIDPARSILVGDKQSDIEAAQRAGVAGHLFTGGNLLDHVAPHLKDLRQPFSLSAEF